VEGSGQIFVAIFCFSLYNYYVCYYPSAEVNIYLNYATFQKLDLLPSSGIKGEMSLLSLVRLKELVSIN
jgi:hypothetical protein